MGALWQDLRYAARMLRRNTGFAAVALLTLALGIGANTAIFSVVQAVLLRPLPYHDPDRLVVVMGSSTRRGGQDPSAPGTYYEWREQNKVFDSIAAAEAWDVNMTGGDRPEQVPAMHVSANLFETLGVKPFLGRTFLPEDEPLGSHQVAVLSYGLWQRRFGGNPSIIGTSVTLSGQPFNVVGVMPPGFRFAPFWQTKAELWAPLPYTPERRHNHNFSSLRVFARLKPGVSLAQAQAGMETVARQLEQQDPRNYTDRTARVTALHEMAVGDVRPALMVLSGAVAFILLIACANVANLMLTRATARRREMALRLAVGASRLALVRQLLVESALLAGFAGALGLALAWAGIRALVAATPEQARYALPHQHEIGVSGMALAFTMLLSLATALIFGLLPAIQASKTDPNEALKEGGRSSEGGARGRLRSVLVTSEMALALMLLAGAGLMIRSFQKLHAIDPGFNPHNVLTMAVSVAGSRHDATPGRAEFYHQLVEQVAVMPGVQSASAVNHIPLAGDQWMLTLTVEGQPPPVPGSEPRVVFRVAMPNYFRTMGIALASGRDFTEGDTAQAPRVAVINETMARRFWPNQDALGRRFRLGGADSTPPWVTVAGVIHDARQWDWAAPPISEMYLPFYQIPAPQSYTTLVVRTAADPAGLTNALQARIWALDKDLPISSLASMEDIVSNSMWQPRFSMLLLGAFAGLALMLAAVGIYGVISYSVSQRTHEIGIRMALGAQPSDVLHLVVRQGAAMAAAGVVIGLAGALALARLLTSLLYGISPTDSLTFVAVALLLAGVAAAASYIPARRASRIDPILALRHE